MAFTYKTEMGRNKDIGEGLLDEWPWIRTSDDITHKVRSKSLKCTKHHQSADDDDEEMESDGEGGSMGGLEDHSDTEGGSSEGGDHDDDGVPSSEDGDEDHEHEMPLPAEDDYEDGLQDLDGDMAMGGVPGSRLRAGYRWVQIYNAVYFN